MGLVAILQSPLQVASGRPQPQAPNRAGLIGLAPLEDNVRSCRCLGGQRPPTELRRPPRTCKFLSPYTSPRPGPPTPPHFITRGEWLLLEEGAFRGLPWLLSPKQTLAWRRAGDREKGPVPTGNTDCPAGCAERDPQWRGHSAAVDQTWLFGDGFVMSAWDKGWISVHPTESPESHQIQIGAWEMLLTEDNVNYEPSNLHLQSMSYEQ